MCVFCIMLFAKFPPLGGAKKISPWAHLFMVVDFHMFHIGQNRVWCLRVSANRASESYNYKHENNGSGHIFFSTNHKCESIPKPRYLTGIVAYEDDQTATFHSIIRQFRFHVS